MSRPILLLLLLLLPVAAREPDVPAPASVWKRLGPPEPGSWRARRPEPGQTFAEYKAADPVRGTMRRRVIYIQPWLTRPASDPTYLRRIAEFLRPFFGREVALLDPAPMPRAAYDRRRRQYSVLTLARALKERLPEDGLCLLGVTDRDLFAPGMSFLFGWGSTRDRVAVMSLARPDQGPEPGVRRRRVLALAAHETGHTLSLPHCTFYRCLMNGAANRRDADARPLLLCPVCRSKLCWNLDLEASKRYRAMAPELKRQGLPADSARLRAATSVTPSK